MQTPLDTHGRWEAQRFQVELPVELSNGTATTREFSVAEVCFVTKRFCPSGRAVKLALAFTAIHLSHSARLGHRGGVGCAKEHDGKA